LKLFGRFDRARVVYCAPALLRFGPAQFLFVLTAPRLVVDEASMRIVLGQVADNYEKIREGVSRSNRSQRLLYQWGPTGTRRY